MNDKRKEEPVVVILAEHEKIEADEYIQDKDFVYRKKTEVEEQVYTYRSLFWARLTYFLALFPLALVIFYHLIKFSLELFSAAFQSFKNRQKNRQCFKTFTYSLSLFKTLTGLLVGVINPNWGKKLLSLFFSLNANAQNAYFSSLFNFSV